MSLHDILPAAYLDFSTSASPLILFRWHCPASGFALRRCFSLIPCWVYIFYAHCSYYFALVYSVHLVDMYKPEKANTHLAV